MVIEGNRVRIIPISEEDTDDIIYWRNNVRDKFIYRDLFTRESHTQWLNSMVKTGKVAQFVIQIKDGRKIGSVFLRDIDYHHKKAEYGIFIGDTEAQGHGYGTEAAKLILEYGFKELGLHKIMLRVLATNERAVRSYEKVGFRQEGYFKDDVFVDGKFEDVIFMAVLKSE